MRKIVVILALIGTMFLVEFLQAENLTSVEEFTLVAIGFVLLAAFTVADLGASVLSLPRVTGYIIAGIVLGPSVTNILSTEVVSELKMFNTLALGLIALNAGLELSVKSIQAIAKTLSATITAKLLLLPITVGGTVYLIGMHIPQWIQFGISIEALSVIALVFSALSIGTSPAIAIAVTSEMGAKGRITDLVLGAAIFKDLVVVIVLAIVIALSKPLLDTSAVFSFSALAIVGGELSLSIFLGIVFGIAIIAYVRYVNVQMLLFIFCLILAAAEISKAVHAELLLVFIAAGFFVRNFSKYEHDILKPLNLVSLPTFIVFFTIAGAAVDLDRTLALFPAAAALALARVAAYFFASHIGGYFGSEPNNVRNRAWLGYLPQAGVTLGLVGIAATQLPGLSGIISDLGVTFVALNLLVGPLGIRMALLPEAHIQSPKPDSRKSERLDSHEQELTKEAGKVTGTEQIYDPSLKQHVSDFELQLKGVFSAEIRDAMIIWKATLVNGIKATIDDDAKSFRRAEQVVEWSRVYGDSAFAEKDNIFRSFISRVSDTSDFFPTVIKSQVPRECLKPQKNETLGQSLTRYVFLVRWLFNLKRPLSRTVPLRAILKVHGELPSFANALESYKAFLHTETHVLRLLQRFPKGKSSASELISEIDSLGEALIERQSKDFQCFWEQTALDLSSVINRVGTPELSTRSIRPTRVEKAKVENLKLLQKLADWGRTFEEIAKNEIHVSAIKAQIQLKLDHLIRESVLASMEEITDKYGEAFKGCSEKLSSLSLGLSTEVLDAAEIQTLHREIAQMLSTLEPQKLEKLTHRFNVETSNHRISSQFSKIASTGLGRFRLFAGKSVGTEWSPDDDLVTQQLDFSEVLEDCLTDDLASDIENQLAPFKEHLENLEDLPLQLDNILKFSLETDGDSTDVENRQAITSSLKVSVETLDEQLKELRAAAESATTGIEEAYTNALAKIDEDSANPSLTRVAIDRVYLIQDKIDQLIHTHRNTTGIFHILKAIAYTTRQVQNGKKSLVGIFHKARNRAATEKRFQSPDLRTYSEQLDVSANFAKASALFRKGFSLEPLRDKKFFTANKNEFDSIVATANEFKKQSLPSSVLVIGEPGSGKTSLLNVVENEFDSGATVRLLHSTGHWRGNLQKRLAAEIGCDLSLISIKAELNKSSSVVLVDDLEYWFKPSAVGVKSLQRFLDIISSTRENVMWIVSTSFQFYDAYGSHIGLEQPFASTYKLTQLSYEDLKEVVFSRLSYSGVQVQFRRVYGTNWLEWFRFSNEADIFFRILTRLSRGNILFALTLWVKSINFSGEKFVVPSITPLIGLRIDYATKLPKAFLGILVVLTRYGPLSEREIAEALGASRTSVRRALQHLESYKQLLVTGRRVKYYQVIPRMRANSAFGLGGV